MSVKAIRAMLIVGVLALGSGSALAQNAEVIKRGKDLATAADCVACHTGDPSKPFAGGDSIETPFGVIYGTNITPDKETGIGNWSDDDFVRAVREGVAPGRVHLYPAMPYPSFVKMSRADVLAIKAYLCSLPAIHQTNRETTVPFPFNQRWLMVFWNWLNLKGGELTPDQAHDQAWNRGRYLVEALAHCGECHTPRNVTEGVETSHNLGGGNLETWLAFNVTSDWNAGIGGWSEDEIAQYLLAGNVAGKASASGPMAQAIENSLQYLPETDLRAIAVYLKATAAIPDGSTRPRYAWGQPRRLLRENLSDDPGQALFLGNCATGHGADGAGRGQGLGSYPSLFHHSSVGASDPRNLITVVLHGVNRKMTGIDVFMPSFADVLNDSATAALVNYVRRQFGNGSTNVTAEDVAHLRKGGAANITPLLVGTGAAAAVIIFVIAVIVYLFRRRRPRVAAGT